jgi:hypothetical protein
MSSSNRSKEIYATSKILDFYTDRLENFGDSPQGVGWKDDEAQLVRFAQLLKVIQDKSNFSINDLGCGSGRLYKYMVSSGCGPSLYHGYDILEGMLQSAEKSLLPDPKVMLTKIESPLDMVLSDYTVASGIFNVKYETEEKEWLAHVLSTIEAMQERSKFGFAFNLLTKYSDKEYIQPYLYYADPLFLFDFCKRKFSKNVALLHDYFQYDFTIIVRRT